MISAALRERSVDESDVRQALIDKKAACTFPAERRAIRVVPRLRSSLSFLWEGMADGAFLYCQKRNHLFAKKGFDLNNGMDRT